MEKEASKGNKKAHVLVVPYPAQGHVNPMLQFCKRLIPKGIKITLANWVHLSKSIPSDPNNPIKVETISDGHDERGFAQAESDKSYLETLRVVGSKTLASLIQKLIDSDQPVTAVIYDGFIPWALDVAKQFRLVGVVFFTQTCAVNNIYYHVHRKLLSLPLTDPIISIPGLPPLKPSDAPSYVHAYGAYPGFEHTVFNQFINVDDADWILFSTFYELEAEVVDWMKKRWRLKTVGPTIPSKYLDNRLKDDKDYDMNMFRPDSSICMNWLNDKPNGSVIYVSFGSLVELEPEQVKDLAWGLKASDHYFLWSLRASEMPKLPNEFIEETSDKGLVVPWSPQLEVLGHESIGCFVTHCGLNSVLEAICMGVPMVGMPQWTDQFTNAKFVEDVWGIGVRAAGDQSGIVRKEEIAQCVHQVMQGGKGKEMKKNAINWRKLSIEAVDESGSSDRNTDDFVAGLVSSSE